MNARRSFCFVLLCVCLRCACACVSATTQRDSSTTIPPSIQNTLRRPHARKLSACWPPRSKPISNTQVLANWYPRAIGRRTRRFHSKFERRLDTRTRRRQRNCLRIATDLDRGQSGTAISGKVGDILRCRPRRPEIPGRKNVGFAARRLLLVGRSNRKSDPRPRRSEGSSKQAYGNAFASTPRQPCMS